LIDTVVRCYQLTMVALNAGDQDCMYCIANVISNYVILSTSLLCCIVCLSGDSVTEATGDFIILESSKYVHFLPDASPVAVNEIAPIIAASFGLPFQKVDI